MPRSSLPALLTIPLLVGLAACANPPGTITPGSPPGLGSGSGLGSAAGAITALPASLIQRFDGCADLLTYYQANALEQVGPYGLGGNYGYGTDDATMAAADDGAESAAGGGDTSAPAHSSTNVQEVGVDEADLVKTNGAIIVTATSGKVRIVDVSTQQVISSVRLPGRNEEVQPSELLLHGDTLVVLSQEWSNWMQPTGDRQAAFAPSRTIITTVDLTDPAHPQTVGSVRLEGNYVSARMIDESIRLVMVTEPPGLEQTWPTKSTMAAEEEAEATNRELISASTIEDWVPHLQELDAYGATVATTPLLDCDEISRPRDPAGLSTMSILTFDVGSATPTPTSGTGLVASGSTVYASTDRLIVGTNRWDSARWGGSDWGMEWDGGGTTTTDLHSFDISDPSGTTYRGSGTVKGYLLSQWAIDEEDGVIRVATTTDPREASADSESSLIVMREDGEKLVETGRVDGLGVTEQVRSVRYLTPDLAAVVTFRQTDPLYLIDTSDPASPRVAGELKIPGYSAYLHPIGEGQLLGIGQDADPKTGQTKGLQVSLFDISDTSAPRQVDVMTWEDTYTTIEWDHRAFTSWPTTGQVFVPISHYAPNGNESFAGVLALSVGEGSLSQDARVSTAPKENSWGEGPLRTMVIGEDLWTLDYQGLGRFDLDTMTGGWAIDLP